MIESRPMDLPVADGTPPGCQALERVPTVCWPYP